MKFHIDTTTGPHVGVAMLSGRIDAGNRIELQNSFMSWLLESTLFVFDCSGLDFIDTSGLGAIISCLRKAIDQKGDLKLAALGPKVSMVFELSRAKKLFSIYPDAAEAVRSYATGTME
ncbi:MAG: STAS domain-containing protein [Chlorobiaceae bacterium]|nr:STAS domain-containing protein [Chlorobiaceae bacterium]